MSVNALEKALWQIYLNPADAQRYKGDVEAYSREFRLDEDERAQLAGLDVMGMISHGANPLLVMMVYQTVEGVHKLADYFQIVNQPAGNAPAAS